MSSHHISPSLVASIEKLIGPNYYNWKFGASAVLRLLGALSVVNGTEERPNTRDRAAEWDRLSEIGLTVIGLSVDPSQYVYIRDAKTGPAAWAALQAQYQKNSRANRIALKRQLYGTQQDSSAPIREYTSRVLDIAARLRAIGVSLKDEDIVDVLIFNLHPDWMNVATTLSTAQGELKIADVVSTLEDEESRRSLDPGHTSALYAHGSRSRDAKSTPRACYTCGQPGHIARDCPKRARPDDGAHIALATPNVDEEEHAF